MKKTYIKALIILFGFFSAGNVSAQDQPVNIHGFISQGYIKTTGNNYITDSVDGSFQFNEMGINFMTPVGDKLLIGMQFFAHDNGNIGNDEIKLDWAFADYRVVDWFGIRAGKIKNPVGLYHETRDIDMLRTSIILPPSVYDDNLRDSLLAVQGLSFYGEILTNSLGSFNYHFLIGSNNLDTDGGTAIYVTGLRFDTSTIEVGTTRSYALQWFDPYGYLRLSFTMLFAELDIDGETTDYVFWDAVDIGGGLTISIPEDTPAHFDVDNIEIYIGSLEFTWESLVFSYEYKVLHANTATTLLGLGVKDEFNYLGYYGQVSYRMTERFVCGIYYSEFFMMEDDRDGETYAIDYRAWQKLTTLTFRYDINDNWIVKLEGTYIDGAANIFEKFNTESFKKYWWLYACKVSYSF